MSINRYRLAEELGIKESDIICKNCIKARDKNRGMCYCDSWKGRVYEEDFCAFFEMKGEYKNV